MALVSQMVEGVVSGYNACLMSPLRLLLFHQRGVGVVLLNYFLMNTGFYLLVPFIALHGTRDLGLTAAMAGVVLGVRQFVQQGLGIFGGALGDRIGYKATLSIGLLIRALGFASFAFAADTQGLLIAALIAALGGALYDSPSNAALATLTPPEHRAAAFSLYGIASRLGSALGPALGIWLLAINFSTLSLVAASFYVAGFVLMIFGMPDMKPGARIAAEAGGGEVLVSATTMDLVAGSGLEFEDRGTHELKGVPGPWHLHAVPPERAVQHG